MKSLLFSLAALSLMAGSCAESYAQTHDPNLTATIFVGGFDPDGAEMTGVYGEDTWDPSINPFADLAGLPTIADPGGRYLPPVFAATEYYGDTPPDYYTAQDLAEIDAVINQWGGGVPLYALIVAKYARFVMERAGSQQVNFLSGSFGSYVTRWLIEKDCEQLASEGLIARWLSVEGVVNGHWAASNGLLLELWDLFGTPTIDVDHMHYGWCEAHLHSPHYEADNAWYGDILIGFIGTTDDNENEEVLTLALRAADEPQANDGVVPLFDSWFHVVTGQSRFQDLIPTFSHYDRTHYTLADDPGAQFQGATFLIGYKRVTITITRTQVTNLPEPDDWWWDWMPGEVVIQSRAYAPVLQAQGIESPLSNRHRGGVNVPIRNWEAEGDQQYFQQIVFDDLLTAAETVVDINFWADEIDWDESYNLYETIGIEDPIDEMSGGWMTVPVTHNGSYTFNSADWNCDFEVTVYHYPFNQLIPNAPPVADAGPDQVVDSGELVSLDGTGSWDPEQNHLEYAWTAPAGINLSDATNPTPSFTAPVVDVAETFTFTLVVSDYAHASEPDQVDVTVTPAAPLPAPVNLTLVIDGGWVALSWDTVPGATGYLVYSSQFPYQGYVVDVSGSFDATSWTAPVGPARFYQVAAVN